MTLQHFLRTLVVAGFGVVALALINAAHAEGGEGSSAIPPETSSAVANEPEQTASIAAPEAVAATVPKSRGLALVRAGTLRPLIARYARQHDVPFELADAVVRIESRYNASARNGPNLGLTQVNFRTAQSLGYPGDAAGLFDAETNLRYGLKYLAQAYKLAGGDLCGAVLRYQAGHRAQTMTNASRIYCAKVKTIIANAG